MTHAQPPAPSGREQALRFQLSLALPSKPPNCWCAIFLPGSVSSLPFSSSLGHRLFCHSSVGCATSPITLPIAWARRPPFCTLWSFSFCFSSRSRKLTLDCIPIPFAATTAFELRCASEDTRDIFATRNAQAPTRGPTANTSYNGILRKLSSKTSRWLLSSH